MKSTLKGLLCLGLIASMAGVSTVSADSCCTTNNTTNNNCCSNRCSDQCSDDCFPECATCKPKLLIRSQGENRARDYAGEAHLMKLNDRDEKN